MIVAPLDPDTLGKHVSECPGGNVEYMLRLLFDFWSREKISNVESMIRETHMSPKMADKMRTSTREHIEKFRTSTLDVIGQI